MRPTIDEQLDGVRRLLDTVGRDAGLSPASRELLGHARRLVDRVGGSWAATPAFLDRDNATLAALLAELGTPPPPAEDVDPAARNVALREHLGATIRTLPRDAAGTAARARIGDYLRRRVAADPT